MSLQFVTWDESFRLNKYMVVEKGKIYAFVQYIFYYLQHF